MAGTARHDAWSAGDSYDRYMGRWSRQIAPRFLDWLNAPTGQDWLEVGCGTGALSAEILARTSPRRLLAIDPSAGFIDTARANVPDQRIEFRVGDAQALPAEADSFDVIASALALNFVPDRLKALGEMRRVARQGGLIGFYVWDYPGGGIEFMRAFWTAATQLDTSAADLTEDKRFPFCTLEGLTSTVRDAGLDVLDRTAIEVATVFRDFDDYWQPFTLGAGPAPGYCMSLDPERRERLRQKLHDTLPRQRDGSIRLNARAWAIMARVG
jgi:SAM-dependent methyltransferase